MIKCAGSFNGPVKSNEAGFVLYSSPTEVLTGLVRARTRSCVFKPTEGKHLSQVN